MNKAVMWVAQFRHAQRNYPRPAVLSPKNCSLPFSYSLGSNGFDFEVSRRRKKKPLQK